MHHGHTRAGTTEFAILSDSPFESPGNPPTVSIQIYAGDAVFYVNIPSDAAKDLAERLARAAMAAITPTPKIIPFTLNPAPETA